MLLSRSENLPKTIPVSFITLFRVVFLSWYLIRVLQTFRLDLYDLAYRNPYNPIPLFEALQIPRMTSETFVALSAILILSLLVAIEGRWARFVFPLIAATSFLRIGTSLGYYKAVGNPYVPHSQNILMLFLILFIFTPVTFHQPILTGLKEIYYHFFQKRPLKEYASVFHLLPFKLILCVSYFGAAYVRLKTNGLGWLDGYTLQGYLYDRYNLVDLNPALFLAKSHTLCRILSVLLTVFELTFFVTCFHSYLFILGSFVAIFLHFLILYFMGINFLNWHVLNFSIVIPELLLVGLLVRQKLKRI